MQCTKQEDSGHDMGPGHCMHPLMCGRIGGDCSVTLCVRCVTKSEKLCLRTNGVVYTCRCKAYCWPWSEKYWPTKQVSDKAVARLGPLGVYQCVDEGVPEN
jgi:hypothetical protein